MIMSSNKETVEVESLGRNEYKVRIVRNNQSKSTKKNINKSTMNKAKQQVLSAALGPTIANLNKNSSNLKKSTMVNLPSKSTNGGRRQRKTRRAKNY